MAAASAGGIAEYGVHRGDAGETATISGAEYAKPFARVLASSRRLLSSLPMGHLLERTARSSEASCLYGFQGNVTALVTH